MSETESKILESWPALKEDLKGFLSDTDAWIIDEIRKAYEEKDWSKILKIIDLMDTMHNLSHSH
ncbi:hypothetical protein ACFLTB_07330 [Chloroflexota bacterium]